MDKTTTHLFIFVKMRRIFSVTPSRFTLNKTNSASLLSAAAAAAAAAIPIIMSHQWNGKLLPRFLAFWL